ncbi:ribonuclease H-like domain-containing protein [Tanacetum coccineum]
MDRSFTLGSTEEADNVKILQSCNGLLLCGGSGMPVFDYVYNPSTNQYKKLPYSDCSLDNSLYYSSAGLRIAFDPTKSPHYKLVDAGRIFCDIDVHIYSLETGKWSLCSDHFNYFSFDHFDSTIYWNDGLHWLETENRQLMHYNLNIEDTDHPVITTIPIPQRGMTFLKSYGYMDPMQILIQMSHL